MESTKKEIKYVSNKPLKLITIVALLLILVLFIIQWVCVNNNIEKIKQTQKSAVKAKQDITTFYFNFTKTKDKQILLSPEEFKKMYEHVNALAEKVSEESKRTQEYINQDIDRLNLFMSIGIGFITILGVFVPILVNVLSFDDLKNKQTELDTKQTELDTNYISLIEDVKKIPTDKIDEAIEKSAEIENMSQKINKIDVKINTSLPKVSILSLQNSIIRYFYMSPILMSNLIREQDGDTLVKLITSIKDGFIDCKNNSNLQDCDLQRTLEDFVLFIQDTRFQSTFLNKKITTSFFELGQNLNDLLMENGNSDVIYLYIDNKFIEIIDLINKYNVKAEPAIA